MLNKYIYIRIDNRGSKNHQNWQCPGSEKNCLSPDPDQRTLRYYREMFGWSPLSLDAILFLKFNFILSRPVAQGTLRTWHRNLAIYRAAENKPWNKARVPWRSATSSCALTGRSFSGLARHFYIRFEFYRKRFQILHKLKLLLKKTCSYTRVRNVVWVTILHMVLI